MKEYVVRVVLAAMRQDLGSYEGSFDAGWAPWLLITYAFVANHIVPEEKTKKYLLHVYKKK